MDRLLDLLREARPDIIGGLVFAAVVAVVGIIGALVRFLWNRLRRKPPRGHIEITYIIMLPEPVKFEPPSALIVDRLAIPRLTRRPEPRFIPHPPRRPERRFKEMSGLLRLLRESLPEIIGGLAVAAALAFLGTLYAGWGVLGPVIAVGAVIAILLLVVWLSTRTRKEPIVPTRPYPPPLEPSLRIPQPPRRPEPRFILRHDREGRDLVKRVSEALGANGLVTIWGAGGVGKTTLAIEVAHRLFPRPYTGGVIWDTADGRTDFALVTLLDRILTDLGREEARTLAPGTKADLADRLLTEAMPCLLVLDRFEIISQQEKAPIIDFLKDLSCPVLVTTRERLPMAQNIPIGPMTLEEARQFLKLCIEQSSQPDRLREMDLRNIAEVAEYNPMLMRWVVAQLEQAMRPRDVFHEIARGKGEAVDRIFGRTFPLLGADGQMALLALALFRPSASREALAAVCGFEDVKDRVNEAIRTLAAFDLLDTAVEGDRLGIVGLTRRLTEAQLKKDERTEGLKEHFVAHFLTYAQAHPEVTKEDLDALDDERENLLAALDYAYAAQDWESVMGLREALEEFLDLRGYWDEAIRWGERAAEAASQANLPTTAAIFSGNVGTIRHWRGDYAQAREAYQKALLFFQEAGDEIEVAVALHQLGMVAQDQGDYKEAKNLYDQSLKISRQLGAQAGIAKSLGQLGSIAQLQGDYEEAKDLYNRSLQIEKQLGRQPGIAQSLHNLAIVAQDQGHYQQAKDLYEQSLEIARSLGDQAGIAISLHQLGIMAELQGDYHEAKDLYNQSLEIARSLGDQAGVASSLHQLGIVAQDQGDYQEAETLFNQSLQIATNLGDQEGIASSLHQLGRVAEQRGQVEEAAQLYRGALEIFERIGSPGAEIARESLARVTGNKTKE